LSRVDDAPAGGGFCLPGLARAQLLFFRDGRRAVLTDSSEQIAKIKIPDVKSVF
jgi:hypothetical protein